MSVRRRSAGPAEPQLSVIWWRDIPTQVVASHGGHTVRAELPARFTAAVDRAAMRAGLAGSEDYLAQWDRRARPCGDDLQAEVDAEVADLADRYPSSRLTEIVNDQAAHRTATHPAAKDTA
ncbi:MAG: virulence factor [Actinomycetota bacterium]|nr:virulence factor [Nocardioidaceae bacterium]MDQ3591793.1 virulence factor [Actinomycetota bacterium]